MQAVNSTQSLVRFAQRRKELKSERRKAHEFDLLCAFGLSFPGDLARN